MKNIEQTLTSMEVAEMVGKNHKELLRDIRRYVKQLGESKIALTDFFYESTYRTSQNKALPCYKITKKGCEFIAHKLTGTKGTIFTARYINRFHEMEDIILQREKEERNEIPWFIRKFNGRYIILERDFIEITGVNIKKHKAFFAPEYFRGGIDWNGFGWKCENEAFREKYGFDYGKDDCMTYFYQNGIKKALRILRDDSTVKMNQGAEKMIIDGLSKINKVGRCIEQKQKKVDSIKELPVQINIIINENETRNDDVVMTV